ncbi:hypothetical protein AUR59_008145 [Stutzerimonas balearica]|uniref:Uncharacterized protein n=1 Tax=Stutzerimonas balearica DSM 6083 TaxID=1123016 RepID=A0A8D3Y1J7_9GAMM|nr:hypothetical protein [Stutzerimonas balearica]AJE15543.1 hypothetical protein CL52_11045 [Stutzerimonas balearica DSM 6083]MBS4149263.1 hypothetical protein [Stutzerimonas balearica]MCZ4127264.1 hypothetical protein [Stutzerimonas balearica]OMG67662.1 hypothetical protein AUR59_008145 [Stutzerimonas balearica]SDM47549.1 hypothetical protein SAMN05660875_105120 [Stutzerimonas balearica DSM 6083]
MKSPLRLFLVLLFALALPINGMAQLLMPAAAPKQQAMHRMHAMHDPGAPQAEAPCQDHQQGHATLCKSGQECKTASILQVVAVKAPLLFPATPQATAYPALIPSHLKDAVWHPPRA